MLSLSQRRSQEPARELDLRSWQALMSYLLHSNSSKTLLCTFPDLSNLQAIVSLDAFAPPNVCHYVLRLPGLFHVYTTCRKHRFLFQSNQCLWWTAVAQLHPACCCSRQCAASMLAVVAELWHAVCNVLTIEQCFRMLASVHHAVLVGSLLCIGVLVPGAPSTTPFQLVDHARRR